MAEPIVYCGANDQLGGTRDQCEKGRSGIISRSQAVIGDPLLRGGGTKGTLSHPRHASHSHRVAGISGISPFFPRFLEG